jgi:tRNA threonylcarbamoyladenosine biosynthesis protein TsaE
MTDATPTAPAPLWSWSTVTDSAAATRSLAEALAARSRPGDLVLLTGGLGAGKTTFAQGFARGLGVTGPVTSPTFTLVRQYPSPGVVEGVGYLLHADVYRLDSLAEVIDLGLPEQLEDGAVALIEWGDVAEPVLGPSAMTVRLEPVGDDDGRRLTISGRGPDWVGRGEPVGGPE